MKKFRIFKDKLILENELIVSEQRLNEEAELLLEKVQSDKIRYLMLFPELKKLLINAKADLAGIKDEHIEEFPTLASMKQRLGGIGLDNLTNNELLIFSVPQEGQFLYTKDIQNVALLRFDIGYVGSFPSSLTKLFEYCTKMGGEIFLIKTLKNQVALIQAERTKQKENALKLMSDKTVREKIKKDLESKKQLLRLTKMDDKFFELIKIVNNFEDLFRKYTEKRNYEFRSLASSLQDFVNSLKNIFNNYDKINTKIYLSDYDLTNQEHLKWFMNYNSDGINSIYNDINNFKKEEIEFSSREPLQIDKEIEKSLCLELISKIFILIKKNVSLQYELKIVRPEVIHYLSELHDLISSIYYRDSAWLSTDQDKNIQDVRKKINLIDKFR